LFADCLVDASKNSSANTIDAYEGLPVRVKKVSAGYAFSLVISADDDMVYAAGYNNLGRTGLGTVTGNTASFRMPLARTVTDISAGYTHALAIDHTGSIWSWGNGANYRTGQPSTGTFTFPRKILNFPPKGVKAVRVEGGYTNSLVLCDDGKVYAFGANTSGLNGNGTTSGNVQVPTVIGALTHIKDIALSQLSAVAVDSTGNVWVWGNQANGRLGNGATASATVIPTKITFPKPIKQVAMGSNHGIAVSEDGITLYGWGAGQGWGSAVGGLTGTGSATATATSPSPIDITDFLVNVTKKDQIAKEARFSLATDTIVYVAASRFEAAGAAVGGTLVVTNRNVYGAGSSATAPLLGLGTFQRTGAAPVAKYSPENVGTGAAAVYFRGFYPVYEGAMYEGIRFSQASMSGGTGNYPHSLLAQELTGATTSGSGVTTAQSGGYGYGTGAVYYRQLGAVDPTYTPIYIFTMLKK
jgi:alpha-tubulin suppressor-like RCC1 family protein